MVVEQIQIVLGADVLVKRLSPALMAYICGPGPVERVRIVHGARQCLRMERKMSDRCSIGLAAALLFACSMIADANAAGQTQGPVPNLSSVDFPWLPIQPEYAPPASGPGPVTYDHAHPVLARNPNNIGAVVEAPMRLANLNDPNLKPRSEEHTSELQSPMYL